MDATAGRTDSGAVLIVGAGPRLGAAIARRLGGGNRSIGLIGRSTDTVSRVATSLAADGITAFGATADVADAAALTDAIGDLARRTGPFAVAVHNVSVWREAGAGVLTADDLLADLAAGAASLVTVVNAVLPGMVAGGVAGMAAGGGGTILATGSGAADHPTPGAPSLAVQKAALRILSRGLAAELAPRGVHVATVTVTGGLDTPGFAVADIASVYADLVGETAGPRERWRTSVEFAGTR